MRASTAAGGGGLLVMTEAAVGNATAPSQRESQVATGLRSLLVFIIGGTQQP